MLRVVNENVLLVHHWLSGRGRAVRGILLVGRGLAYIRS